MSKIKKEFQTESGKENEINIKSDPYKPTSKLLDKVEFLGKYHLQTEYTKSWDNIEEQQMLELYKTLGNSWDTISKFINSKPSSEIETHFYNYLRWTGYLVSNDIKLQEELDINKIVFSK